MTYPAILCTPLLLLFYFFPATTLSHLVLIATSPNRKGSIRLSTLQSTIASVVQSISLMLVAYISLVVALAIASLIYKVALVTMRSLSSYSDIRRLISTVVEVAELVETRNAAHYESIDDWGYLREFRLRLESKLKSSSTIAALSAARIAGAGKSKKQTRPTTDLALWISYTADHLDDQEVAESCLRACADAINNLFGPRPWLPIRLPTPPSNAVIPPLFTPTQLLSRITPTQAIITAATAFLSLLCAALTFITKL